MRSKRQTTGQTSHQPELRSMSTTAAMAHFSKRLVRKEQDRSGSCAETALASVARRLRAAPGAFANIIRQRVKKVSADMRDRIVTAALADIEHEIERLDHDKRLLQGMGFGPSHNDVVAVEDAIASARAALARMRGQA
jgi:hypothetical protein